MSYCLNPDCPQPKNPLHVTSCQACGHPIMLRNRYRVLKTLGQGGFGATFLARDESLPGNPSCVIKQLRPATTTSQVLEMAQKLFEREARTLGKIGNHPQVPRLLDFFQDNQQFYLVQEYISGLTLQQEIKQCGPLSEAGVKQFLSEVLPLIKYIHSQEVIHRDIKPANLIRREQDRKLVLIDFGAVKDEVNQAAVANTSDQTALTNFAIGTPGFAPPEQMALRPVYASDIYALGVTSVYLLTGKSPKDLDYNPSTGEMVWRKSVQVSDHFATVLKKMLEASVRHRYQTAEEILRALDLEPYFDSLVQGMAMPTSGLSNTNTNGNSTEVQEVDSPSSPSSPSSATQKLAAAIRKRRERRERSRPGSPNTMGNGNPRSQFISRSVTEINMGNIPSSQSFATSRPKKLDANGVLTAYMKGRRDFASHDLSGLDLQKSDLSGGIFYQSKLTRINLQGADLSSADFGQASLTRANLRDANLGRAYLSNSDLEGADLRGADLSFAYLNHANLKGANLCGANLANAKITEEQLSLAKTNWATIMPNGKRGLWS